MNGYRCILADEAAQEGFGRRLAALLRPGAVIYLRGELGAGKTTLTRGMLRGLGHAGTVKSPTYTIVEPYRELPIPLYHFDLYRLADAEELEYLGIRDYFSGAAIVVVEWPERGQGVLPEADLNVWLEVLPGGRRLSLSAATAMGRECLHTLAESTAESPAERGAR